jgi:hypothetical protein
LTLKTLVREATEADIPAILDLGERFHALSPWRDRPFDREATERTVANLIASPQGVLLFNGEGILGGVLAPIYFGGGLIAQELFWFADRGGRELLDGFETWAREQGACGVLMVNLVLDERTDAIMNRMYERRGYALRERHFYKEL